MANPSFVRKDMLPPEEPPLSERGVFKWVHENLLSSVLNAILTVIGLLFVIWVVISALPWFLNGVWTASSLAECREVIAANAGAHAEGACWALIRTRWHQFIFGAYPLDLYWRPILAFALLFVALAPVLYADNRKVNLWIIGVAGALAVLAILGVRHFVPLAHSPVQELGSDSPWVMLITIAAMGGAFAIAWLRPQLLLWFTLLYPAVGFYLLWGGSVWGPLGALAGFAIIYAALHFLQAITGVVVAAGIGIVVASVWWTWLQEHVTAFLHGILPIGMQYVRSDDFGGFLLAFVIGVTAIAASLPMGILLALGRRSDMPLVKSLCVGFIEFVRGVPLITMLFVASLLLQYFLPPRSNFDLILRVIILVTLFSAAYIAEVIRGGLAALPRGQFEAADALGLDYWQAQRLIIMPQALKISIPGIVSSFIGLFKDTTLVAIVGLADPLQGVRKIVLADINWKGIYWEPFLFVGLIFFLVCFSMSRYSMYLERKLKTDHR
jgi:general L-amino acid transport system permease protein